MIVENFAFNSRVCKRCCNFMNNSWKTSFFLYKLLKRWCFNLNIKTIKFLKCHFIISTHFQIVFAFSLTEYLCSNLLSNIILLCDEYKADIDLDSDGWDDINIDMWVSRRVNKHQVLACAVMVSEYLSLFVSSLACKCPIYVHSLDSILPLAQNLTLGPAIAHNWFMNIFEYKKWEIDLIRL